MTDPDGLPLTATVVVPCAGTLGDLPPLVDALRRQQATFDWEAIFVDNGLAPEALAELRRHASRLSAARIVEERKRGIGPARNAGVRASSSEVVVFVDADDVPALDWLATLVTAVRPGVVVGGHLDTTKLNPPWLAATRSSRLHVADQPYMCEGIFPVAPGGNMAMTRADFDALGGFVPDARPLEDFDLCLRAWEQGLTVERQPDAVLHYRLRTSPRDLFRQGSLYGTARARVYRDLADRHLVRRWTVAGWRSWIMLAVSVPLATVSSSRRATVAWIAGNRWGRLAGSARYRVIYL